MSLFFQQVDSDLTTIIAALGQSYIDRTVTIPCGITRPAAGNEPMEGGMWDDYSGQIFTRRAYYDGNTPSPLSLPVEGSTITVDGKAVYVGKVKSDGTAPLITIMFRNNPAPR